MSNNTVVEVEMVLRLAAPEHEVVPARFRYDQADPYAVSVTFHTEPDAETATWTFARELLATGLDQPAGLGDVRIWPSLWVTPHGYQVTIELSSPDGHAVLAMPRRALLRFLRRTYALVPRGRETSHQDIDAALSRLLNREPG